MKVAVCLFDLVDELDFIPVLEILDSVRRFHEGKPAAPHVRLLAQRATVTCSHGLRLMVDEIGPDLIAYDLLIIPGGPGTREMAADDAAAYLKWLRTFPLGEEGRRAASVCTGALWLARMGWLKGRRATTHHRWQAELARLGAAEPISERVVVDGPVWTAGGVTSAFELALGLVRERYGEKVERKIKETLEYPAPIIAAPASPAPSAEAGGRATATRRRARS